MEMKKKEEPAIFSSGFTLIELMIVICVAAILFAIATPSFVEWRRNLQYKEAAGGIASTLRNARNNAITLNRQNRVEFSPANARYRMTQGDRAYDSSTWPTVKQDWVTLSSGVIMRNYSTCAGTDNKNIKFNPNGTASLDPSGTPQPLTMWICDSSSNKKYKIDIATSGRIKSEKR